MFAVSKRLTLNYNSSFLMTAKYLSTQNHKGCFDVPKARCRISTTPQNGHSSIAGVPNRITTSDTMAVSQGSVAIAT